MLSFRANISSRGKRMKIRFLNGSESIGKSRVMRALLCALVLLLAVPFAGHAQQYSGTITGTVTDPSGAAVAGAEVKVINSGMGVTLMTTTSEQGVYSFAQLQVGTYEIHIKHASFKEFIAKNVEVHVSSTTEINAKLDLGAATEMVTVEASDVQVQTTSAQVGEVVEGTQVRELPLNGENFMGLVTLSPGVSTANSFNSRDKGLTGGADFSVNGNPYNYNLFLVDGVNNNDVGSGRTILVYPSVDAIAEFKMIRNSYGPEYGQAAGSIISITTRGGENQFHGGLFYSGRNDKLDANDWFSNFNGNGKAELRRNDYGYHIAGPIKKDKLWVWWNQEWNKEVRGQSVSSCVPTANEIAGNYTFGVPNAEFTGGSAPIRNDASPSGNKAGQLPVDNCGGVLPSKWVDSTPGATVGTYSLQSTIPAAMQMSGNAFGINPALVDKTGQLVASSWYPAPNVPFANGHNWVFSENQRPDWSEWNVRGDYDLTKKHRITFRWTKDSWTSPAPNPGLFWGDSIYPAINSDWSQPSKSVMAKLTSQIGNSMVNDFEFGYGNNAIITTLTSQSVPLVKAVNAAVPSAWPGSIKNGPAMPGFNAGGWGGLGYGGQEMWTIAPYANHEDLYAVQDNISKVQGNHLWKLGAYYSTNAKIENNNGGTDQPSFDPADGGLNRCPSSNPTCTTNNGQPIGVPTGNPLANVQIPGQVYVTNENSINQVARVLWHDFEWYVGDTWKLRRNVTVSYGFRWSFLREPYSSNNQWASWSLANYDPTRPAGDACNGLIIVPGTHPCQDAVTKLNALGVSLPLSNGTPGPNAALVNNNNHNIAPRIGIAWDVKGDGKTAVRLGLGQFFQREPVGLDEKQAFNAPFVINAQDVRTIGSPAPLASPAVSPCCSKDPRGVVPNSWQWNLSVEREFARNMAFNVGYVGNAGIHLTSGIDLNAVPKADWATSAFLNGSAQNALRPAGNFGQILQFARNGHASYHSLQALYRWRMGNFSQFQAAYTYSHSIANVDLDNSSGSVNAQATTDQSNGRLDKGNTNINRPNIFVANEVFYLPKLANKSGVMQSTLGGWELNSIITVTSGASLTVFSNGAGDAVSSGSLNSLLGSGFNSNNRPLVTSVGCNAGESGRQILNPAAFTFTGFALGTTPGNMESRGFCHGPAYRNVDVQLAKNWNFKERYRVKFSMDFFNMLNHANFFGSSLEGTNFNADHLQCGVIACSATNNVVTGQNSGANNNFGQANSVHPGRELQYTLRFYF